MLSFLIHRHVDDPVYTPADQKFHRFLFQFPVSPAVTHDCCITVAPQNILHPGDDLGTKRIVQFRDHNADGSGRIGLEPSGNLVYLIVKFLNGCFDLYSVFFSDISSIEIGRDRRQTKSCLSGNVLHRCCHFVSLPSVSTDISVY